MLYLCLHLPTLPLDIFTRHQARHFYQNQGGGNAIADAEYIVSADSTAITLGVNNGMSVDAAHTLSQSLKITQRDLKKEQQALSEISDWGYQFSPYISPYSSNSIILEVSQIMAHHSGLKTLIKQLTKGIITLGYQCHYGIAHTPKAAHIRAINTPDTLSFFDEEQQVFNTRAFKQSLNQLALSNIDDSDLTQQGCDALGVSVVGDLVSLPLNVIGAQLGKPLLRTIAVLRGDISEKIQTISAPKQFSRSCFFSQAVEHKGGLRFPMRRLISEFFEDHRQHQTAYTSLEWRISSSTEQQTVQIPLPSTAMDEAQIFELSQHYFEQVKLNHPVEQLTLNSNQHERQNTVVKAANSQKQAKPMSVVAVKHAQIHNVYRFDASNSTSPKRVFKQAARTSIYPGEQLPLDLTIKPADKASWSALSQQRSRM